MMADLQKVEVVQQYQLGEVTYRDEGYLTRYYGIP
jgi:hypothetical protein